MNTVTTIAGLLGIGCVNALPSQPAPPPGGRMIDVGGYRVHMTCRGAGPPTVLLDAGARGHFTRDPAPGAIGGGAVWGGVASREDEGPSPFLGRRIEPCAHRVIRYYFVLYDSVVKRRCPA